MPSNYLPTCASGGLGLCMLLCCSGFADFGRALSMPDLYPNSLLLHGMGMTRL